jgi:hypothetical protein
MVAAMTLAGAFVAADAAAQETIDENLIGVSTSLSGLTGLLTTTSAHTLPPWKVAVSGAGLYAQVGSPTAKRYEGRAIVGLGLPGGLELAALVPGVRTENDNGNLAIGPTKTSVGDAQLAGKWRFLEQREALWPAVALATVVTLPTGDLGTGPWTVQDYGMEVKVIASAEVDLSPDQYAIGLYADGGFFFQDLGQATADKYGTFALGVVLPLVMRPESPLISPLQLLLEMNGTYKRGTEQDLYVFTPSLRYVGPVTVTAGFQYTTFQQAGIDDAVGAVVQAGFIFP